MLKEYFEGMLMLCAFVALAVGISHPRLRKPTGFGAGVLVICVILLPLVDILKGYDGKIDPNIYFENIESDTADEVIELAFEEGIREYLADEYGVDKSTVKVMADGFDMENMRAERIYLTLCGEAALLDYKRIKDKVEREFTNGGECEVSIELG